MLASGLMIIGREGTNRLKGEARGALQGLFDGHVLVGCCKMVREFEPEWMIDPAGWSWARVVPNEEPVRLIKPVQPAQVIEFPGSRKSQEFRGRLGG